MAAVLRLSHNGPGLSHPSPVLAASALAILWPRRNSGPAAVRASCRALVRRWVAVLRGVA